MGRGEGEGKAVGVGICLSFSNCPIKRRRKKRKNNGRMKDQKVPKTGDKCVFKRLRKFNSERGSAGMRGGSKNG